MAPIIAMLAKAGLPLLTQVVLQKGKDFAEQKLGVDLEDMLASDEGKIQLKQLEMEQEQNLRQFLLAAAEQDLASFKEEVKDKDSARLRDAQFLKAGTRNYRADTMYLLAVVVIGLLVWAVLSSELDEYAKGIITLVLGRFLGYLDNIYNFEFGSTRSSKQKDFTIEQLSYRPKGEE
jgi:hypothetical protein